MDRIDAMRLFIRVADAGSFSKAASDLGLGQPTVSRRIQDLEASLDAALFLRTTRSLSLTEAGERFYKRAADILADFDDAEAEARGLDHEPIGLLRISCVSSMARLVIGPRIASFMKLYPHVRVDVLTDDAYTDLVGEGVDLAFRIGSLVDSSLMAKKVGESPRALWAAPDYLDARGTPQHPRDLTQHDAVMFRQTATNEWVLSRDGETVSVKVDGRFKASSGDLLLQAAQNGLGLFLSASWLVSDCVNDGSLVRVMPEWTATPSPIHCVWTSGKLRGKAKLFADHIADALQFDTPPC
ncbi:LysR substrate-binding domain-containing protein [Hyphomonas sp.]|uniref:LysR family transcriptional regulator n=1 Tax=Hyphomonas sp. TaxID=87 RepID=UPI003564FB0F